MSVRFGERRLGARIECCVFPILVIFPCLEYVGCGFVELVLVVGFVDWEEDCAGLHHENSWREPGMVS